MNLQPWADLLTGQRQNGKTTAIATTAKVVNGIVVCRNEQEAKRVEREHGARTFNVLNDPDRLRGIRDPLFFDTDTVFVLLSNCETQLKAAAQEVAAKKAEVIRLAGELGATQKNLEQARQEATNAENLRADMSNQLDDVEGDRDELSGQLYRFEEDQQTLVDVLARLVANPADADALRAAKDLLPAEKGGYR